MDYHAAERFAARAAVYLHGRFPEMSREDIAEAISVKGQPRSARFVARAINEHNASLPPRMVAVVVESRATRLAA